MIKLAFIFCIILLLQAPLAKSSSERCDQILESDMLESSDRLWSYMSWLLDNQIIGQRSHLKFLKELNNGVLFNPIEHRQSDYGNIFENATFLAHYNTFQIFIDEFKQSPETYDLKKLKNLAEEDAKTRGLLQVRKEVTQNNSRIPFQLSEPILISPGKALADRNYGDVTEFTITKPFYLMSTVVTQYQWGMVMGKLPPKAYRNSSNYLMPNTKSILADEASEAMVEIEVEGNRFEVAPDYPVTNMGIIDVINFIKKINQLSLEGSPVPKKIFKDHEDGDQYDLPTEAQYQRASAMVSTVDGQSWRTLGTGSPGDPVFDYAWLSSNSRGMLREVGQKKPLMIEGKLIYDFLGLVSVWTRDSYSSDLAMLVDREIPLYWRKNPTDNYRIVVMGESCEHSSVSCVGRMDSPMILVTKDHNIGNRYLGIRLIKLIREN